MQIICTQIYGFKYSYLILILSIHLYLFQVFLSNTNNLYTTMRFQVLLSNNLPAFLWLDFVIIISITICLYLQSRLESPLNTIHPDLMNVSLCWLACTGLSRNSLESVAYEFDLTSLAESSLFFSSTWNVYAMEGK